MEVGKLIQKGRQEKNLTQKDLATKINEKPQVVTEYETGKGVPNAAILAKMENVLGIKLRGKDKGQPLVPKAKKEGGK
jgi:putative transcription factor